MSIVSPSFKTGTRTLSCSPHFQAKERTIWFHIYTLFLFTKSDFKTVIMPQSIFALSVVLSQVNTLSIATHQFGLFEAATRLPFALAWIWLHLLVENISNQRLESSIIEDAANKPWRPIPAGRISSAEAQGLLRIIMPLAIVLSVLLDSFTASVTLMAMIWLYNDLDGSSSGPIQRNAINAAGLACFGWGGIAILSEASPETAQNIPRTWLALTAAIITTTVHAQDMPDMEGDGARDRKTVPLLYGEQWARYSLAAFVLFWSVGCLLFNNVPLTTLNMGHAPLVVGAVMALLTTKYWNQSSDELVWKLWCIWISLIYVMPLFRR
ncbi:UbiA prenyltransferase [Bisporella sp. PMI_857]|nr:UbiA prenyltransferase [Bisporella sp. PMI_857]